MRNKQVEFYVNIINLFIELVLIGGITCVFFLLRYFFYRLIENSVESRKVLKKNSYLASILEIVPGSSSTKFFTNKP